MRSNKSSAVWHEYSQPPW